LSYQHDINKEKGLGTSYIRILETTELYYICTIEDGLSNIKKYLGYERERCVDSNREREWDRDGRTDIRT